VQRLLHGRPGTATGVDFDGTFDYLEQQVSTELAWFSAPGPMRESRTDDLPAPDPFPADLVLGAIVDMFGPAAAAKGLICDMSVALHPCICRHWS